MLTFRELLQKTQNKISKKFTTQSIVDFSKCIDEVTFKLSNKSFKRKYQTKLSSIKDLSNKLLLSNLPPLEVIKSPVNRANTNKNVLKIKQINDIKNELKGLAVWMNKDIVKEEKQDLDCKKNNENLNISFNSNTSSDFSCGYNNNQEKKSPTKKSLFSKYFIIILKVLYLRKILLLMMKTLITWT